MFSRISHHRVFGLFQEFSLCLDILLAGQISAVRKNVYFCSSFPCFVEETLKTKKDEALLLRFSLDFSDHPHFLADSNKKKRNERFLRSDFNGCLYYRKINDRQPRKLTDDVINKRSYIRPKIAWTIYIHAIFSLQLEQLLYRSQIILYSDNLEKLELSAIIIIERIYINNCFLNYLGGYYHTLNY